MSTAQGVPQKANQQAATAHKALVTHRARALIDQAFGELDSRKLKGKGDFVAKLADQMMEDPLRALERIALAFPEPAQAANVSNINALFLQATQLANGHMPGGKIVEAVVIEGTSRVHTDVTDW